MSKDELNVQEVKMYKVVIDATRLLNDKLDGNTRYIQTLLKSLHNALKREKWPIKIYLFRNDITELSDYFDGPNSTTLAKPNDWIGMLRGLLFFFPKNFKKIIPKPFYNRLLNWADRLGLYRSYLAAMAYLANLKANKYRHLQFDLLHVPQPERAVPHVLSSQWTCTIHDLTVRLLPEYHQRISRSYDEESIKLIENQQAKVIAVSKHTKNDILKHTQIKESSIDVVYEAIDEDRFEQEIDVIRIEACLKKYKIEESPYFISLCTIEPRKNLLNTVKAFIKFIEKHPESKIKLVLAGKYGWKGESIPNHPNIIVTGYLPEEDLSTLLTPALGICYVSYYEGFGLPPLEAMRCGTAAIYGNNSSMKELIGDAGLPANPDDIDEIVSQMEKLAFDQKFREQLEEIALSKSLLYNSKSLGQNMLEYYLKTIEGH